MFRISMLPAAYGDCLLVEYGTTNNVRRVLIDGGVAQAHEVFQGKRLATP